MDKVKCPPCGSLETEFRGFRFEEDWEGEAPHEIFKCFNCKLIFDKTRLEQRRR